MPERRYASNSARIRNGWQHAQLSRQTAGAVPPNEIGVSDVTKLLNLFKMFLKYLQNTKDYSYICSEVLRFI